VSSLDWTLVISATIAAVASIANGLGVVLVILWLRTDSGDSIGHVVERTHDLSAASLMALTEEAKREQAPANRAARRRK